MPRKADLRCPRDSLGDGGRDIGRDGGEGTARCPWSRWQRRQPWFRAATGGVERALLGATGGTQEGKFRRNDSKGGKWVYAHTKPGDQNGNPSRNASRHRRPAQYRSIARSFLRDGGTSKRSKSSAKVFFTKLSPTIQRALLEVGAPTIVTFPRLLLKNFSALAVRTV